MRVERVALPAWLLPLSALGSASARLPGGGLAWTLHYLRGAVGLAGAFRRRHRERPFDLVQSSDFGFTGLLLGRRSGVRHIVRCSWAADLFLGGDGRKGTDVHALAALERLAIRRAHRAYAPSRFLSAYYRTAHELELGVVRPPFMQEPAPAEHVSYAVPERFLMFFGQIGPRKGTDILAAALRQAWQVEPGLTMVWAGFEVRENEMLTYRRLWGSQSDRVVWFGPVARPQLFAMLRRAECAVIPSRWDNFPNTALESLALGVPVIGTRGSSIEEIVEPGVSGDLVEIGDVSGLARALVAAWRGSASWSGKRLDVSSILRELQPEHAVRHLLDFALSERSSHPRRSAPALRMEQ